MKLNKVQLSLKVAAVLVLSSTLLNTVLADDKRRYVRESIENSDHYAFNTSDRVNGATTLVRDFENREVVAHISSKALEPDTAYSIWWAVFNRPRYCEEPYTCKVSDLEAMGGDPRVRASVFWGGGFVSDDSGTSNTTIELNAGRTGRELFGNTKNYGLQNLIWAEIHVVLRSHGPVGVAGPVSDQIGTANEACPDDGCKNVFASVHKPGG